MCVSLIDWSVDCLRDWLRLIDNVCNADLPKSYDSPQPTSNCIEQSSSWESGGCSSGEEIPHVLQNLEVYCCVHKIPPLVLFLNRIFSTHPACLCMLVTSGLACHPLALSLPFRFIGKLYVHLWSSPLQVTLRVLVVVYRRFGTHSSLCTTWPTYIILSF